MVVSGNRSGSAGIAEAITIGFLQTPLDGATTFPAEASQAEATANWSDTTSTKHR